MPEAWLLWQARRGQATAFAALYQRHYRRVFRLAWLLLGAADRAEVLTARVFATAWRDVARLSTPTALRLYLCRLIMRDAAAPGIRADAAPGARTDTPPDPRADPVLAEVDVLQDVVRHLPWRSRVALALVVAAGLPPALAARLAPDADQPPMQVQVRAALAELAVLTHWPPGHVRRTLQRTLQDLEPPHRLWEWSFVAEAPPLPADDAVDLRDRLAPLRWAGGVALFAALAVALVLRGQVIMRPDPVQARPARPAEAMPVPPVDVTTQMILNGAMAFSPVEMHAGFGFTTQQPADHAWPAALAEQPATAADVERLRPTEMRLPAVDFAAVEDLRLTVLGENAFLAWRSGRQEFQLSYFRDLLRPTIVSQGTPREIEALPGDPAGILYRDDLGAYAYQYLDGHTYLLASTADPATVRDLVHSNP